MATTSAISSAIAAGLFADPRCASVQLVLNRGFLLLVSLRFVGVALLLCEGAVRAHFPQPEKRYFACLPAAICSCRRRGRFIDQVDGLLPENRSVA